MINLLPKEKTKKIKKEKVYLLSTFLMIYLIFFLFAFSGTLYGLSFIAANMLKNEKHFLEEKEDIYFNIIEEENLIKEVNKISPKLKSFYQDQVRISVILKKISDSLTTSSYLNNFRLTREGSDYLVTLEGYAESWDDLLFIENSLKEHFSEVSFSPGIWAQVSDINFTITFQK